MPSYFSALAHSCFSWVPCKSYDMFMENCCVSNSECFLCMHCSSFPVHSSSHSNLCRVGSQLLKTEETGIEEGMVASFGNLANVNARLNGAAGPCEKVRFSTSSLFLDMTS